MSAPQLHHLTSEFHWARIDETGALLPLAEAQRRGLFVGSAPPVCSEWDALIDSLVWLTRNPRPHQPWQMDSGVNKGQVRIVLAPLPDALP